VTITAVGHPDGLNVASIVTLMDTRMMRTFEDIDMSPLLLLVPGIAVLTQAAAMYGLDVRTTILITELLGRIEL
jgi:hypothetical protein